VPWNLRKLNCSMVFALSLFSCHGDHVQKLEKVRTPGYWFQIILIVLPLFIILVKGLMDLGEIKDSLLSIGSQNRRMLSRLEELEDQLKAMEKPVKSEKPRERED